MKKTLLTPIQILLMALAVGYGQTSHAQTAWAAGSSGNWNTAASWSPVVVPGVGTNASITASGTFTVTYDAPMAAASIASLTFGSGTDVPTLTLTAAGFNVAGSTTTGGSGVSVLNVSSGGVMNNATLNLSDYNGNVNVNNGGTMTNGATQVANNGNNDGTGALKINSGAVASLGAVTVGRNNQGTSAGLIIAGGTISASSIAIGTRNSYSTMVVSGGTLTNSGSLQIGTGPGTSGREVRYYQTGGTVNCAGTLDLPVAGSYPAWFSVLNAASTFSASGIRFYPNVVSGSSVKFTNSGTIYLGAGGFTALNSGSYTAALNDQSILGANADWGANITFTAPSGTITFKCADANNNAHNITLTNPISGGASLSKTGGGNLLLLGANTYSGSTTNAAGKFLLGNASALPKGTALTLGSTGNSALFDLAGFNVQISGLATAGTAASQTLTNSSAVNTSILTFSNPAANSVFGGSLSGNKPVALTILGGNLTLSGQNNYGGNLLISSGKLTLSGAGSTFTGAQIVLSNAAAALDLSGMGGISLGTGQNLSGYGGINGNVTATNCPVSPGATGNPGTLTFSNNLTLNGAVTNHFDLSLDPASGNDLISVGGALNVAGTNIIEINPLTGTLSVGTYKLIKFGSLGSGGAANFQVAGSPGPSLQTTVSVAAAEIDLVVSAAGGSQRLWVGDGLTNAWDYSSTNWLNSGTPDVFSDGKFVTFDDTGSTAPPVNLTTTLQPATVLVNAAGNYTFSGAGKISGTGSLTKTNSGTLIILTTNNFSGPTTIAQGTLQLGNGLVSGTLGTNAIQNSGLLLLDLSGSNGLANVISGTGRLTQAGAGTLTLTASNLYSGGTTISNGTLQLNTGAWFGSGKVTNNGTLIFNSTANSTVSAVISGTGALALANSGTVTLTGNNSYSGGTAINKGTLLVNNSSGSGVGNGALTVTSGATLSGSGVIGGAVTINSGGIFAPGNPTGTLTVSNNFTANSGAILNYTLGTTSDKTIVSSNLNLSGTLNITAGTGFAGGNYTLFTYGGTLNMGGLTVTVPANSNGTIDTSTPGQVNLVISTLQTNIPAFPGAIGFGAGATGARIGGSVYHVTTLADSGAGSFRDAVSKSGRIIVFDVGGTVNLVTAVSAKGNLTIAGQTAPGGGICFNGGEISFANSANIICRHIRIRPGSDTASTGDDCLSLYQASNIIMDHVSLEFGPWNNIDAVGCADITVQNSIDANPTGQQFGAHTESVGENYAWFYNVFANSHNRNPLAKINTVFINNVEYNNSAGYTTHTSTRFKHDIVNNYFIYGPASGGNFPWYQIDNNQSMYFTGNLRDSSMDGTLNGSTSVPLPGYQGGGTILAAPWSTWTTNVTIYNQNTAYRLAVSQAGALPRDDVDTLVISQMKTLGSGTTGTGVGTRGPDGGLYTSQAQTGLSNNGYGTVVGGLAPVDTDKDGMPDYWESALGSNPNVDDSLTPGIGGYTKLENYLNWLAMPHASAPKNSLVDVDLRQFTAGFTNVSPVYAVLLPTNGAVVLLADGHTAEFTAAGNFSGLGSFNFSVHGSDGSALTNTVGVLVTATGLSQNLTWRGDGSLNNWDNSSTNWVNGTNRFTFTDGVDTTFDDTGSNTPAINLVGTLQPASVTVAANQNYTFSGPAGAGLGGVMLLAKDGAGVLIIGTSNTFSGGTFVTGGTVTMGNTTANSSGLGTGVVTLGDGTRLNLFDNGQVNDAGTLPNSLAVSGNTTLELPERGTAGAAGATLTGSGVFNLICHWARGTFNFDCSGFAGTFNALTTDSTNADFRMGSYAGFAGASVNFSNNINAYFTATISPAGNTVDFGQLNAPASATLRGGPTGGRAVTLRIGALDNDSSFAGAIVEQTSSSSTSLVKIGAGTLTLGGADTYNGQTVISNGTLVVNGSTSTNRLTVVSGTLGGGGAIGGGATLYSGNAISPGATINPGAVGTLTITNGLTLTNATLYFDLASATNAGGGVNDLISLAGGALTLSGANTVAPDLLNGFLSPGNYTLISGGSSTIGSAANLAWAGSTGTRQTFSFNTATPGTVLLNVAGSPPAKLVWQGTNGSAWDLNTTVNWRNNSTADKFFNLDSVVFDDTATNNNVVISGTVQPGQVSLTNSILNYNLGGGVLGGAGPLSKNGSGNLTLGGSNSFSGGTFINGGTIILSNDVANQFALGTGAVTLAGGTLTMHDDVSTFNAAYWNLIVPTNFTGTLNTDSRCDLYGSLTGGGTLNFNVTYVRTSLFGDWSAFTGNINVTGGGEFRVLNFSGYPNAAINLSGTSLMDFQGAVDPDGTTLQIGALSGGGASSLLGGATAGNVFNWQIGGANVDATFAGTIAEQNTNTITAIEKIGTGLWTLTGNNTFSGGLTVSGGTLQVNNATGSATGTNQVFIAEGAALSGNGNIAGLTVFDDGAILAPGNPSGTLTINNELDLSDLTVLNFGLGTNSDQVVVTGDLNVGGQLNITDNGGFGTGTYTLFNYGGALTLGNLTIASAPAGFFYTISTNTAGQINLVVTRPQFNNLSAGANGLVMNGSGGMPNGIFYLLGSTNIATPLNLWTRIATNQFDASGNFNFTNVINPGTPQSFYRLQLP